jgi:hypothetical protein
MDLAIIISAAVSEDIQAMLAGVIQGPYWVGARVLEQDSSWYWVDGTSFMKTYTNWRAGDPGGASSGPPQCLAVDADGQWNDDECSSTSVYVCGGAGEQLSAPWW